ncbi:MULTISPECIES: hypothetical protein [Mycobacterium]|uniref:Terminase n=1 Tax=Mycobacterium branderi TaxID=43348 RepID=A0ABN6AYZ9_9MYCO|nr:MULTISPECIES: hypothetical protein [Mycobacterium]MCV7232773.1 hypothetical protein [Mycobacterium branderi]BBZ09871.1 hypothetical protein MBRA_00660 [Mycobacterium branderi]
MPGNALSVREKPLLGDQTPRILVTPPAVTSAAAEAIEFAASVGLILDPWQQLILEHSLGELPGGSWSAFEVGLCVPRQNGKSAVAEARMLAGLFVLDEELIVYSAHLFDTAMETMRRLEQWLDASGEKFTTSRSNGKEGFELATGQRVKFKTRTKGGGRGLSGDCVILDEAMILESASIGALMPTLAARPNPQLWYMGSAVDQEIHDKGYVFASVRKRALARSSPRLCYAEFSCEDGADPADPRNRAQANPGMGYRITPEYIEDEYQALIHTPKIFLVERLGIGDWPTLADTLQPPIGADLWHRLTDRAPAVANPFPQTIGVDRDPVSKTWAIAGAQHLRGGGVHVELGWTGLGSPTDVAERLVDVVTEADPVALVIDQRSPAAVLKPYLAEAGIDPHLTNASELAMGCEGFLEAALAAQVSHPGQEALDSSVVSAVKRDLPGGRFAWDKPPGGSIVQLMAVTLAHWGLLAFAKPPKRSAPPLLDKPETSSEGVFEREFDAMTAAF